MTTKQEIKFWQKAAHIIRKSYGKPCKQFCFGCATCEANLGLAWIEKHLDLLRWESK